MQPAQEKFDVGVIIARFQVHELHQAHRDLIDYVVSRHKKVIVFLGLSPLKVSTNNPLDFEARKQMIQAAYPDVTVVYINDMHNDEPWSRKLDMNIDMLVTPNQSVVLYGGRDSFISHYTGIHPTQELTQSVFRSGTAERKEIARSSARSTADFRAGVIWASQARYPTVYTTVDIAVFGGGGKLLLGRKPNEKLYRFIGGFADPRSESFEADAIREVAEEASIEVGDLKYLGSHNINDWRYRNEPDGIRTMLFKAKYLHGRPAPGDDIEEVRWFDFDEPIDLVPEHRPLMVMLRKEVTA